MNTDKRDDKKRGEETADAVVVIESPDQINQRDDQEIVQMMTGQAIDAYVYSFRQGGKTVEGLTLAGVNEAANRRGGIQVEEAEYEDRENSWIAVVKATDTLTGNSRYGACEQPKKQGGRDDPYAFTKAVHKAQRNAVKQLLPTPVIQEVIDFYRQAKGRRSRPVQAPPKKPLNDKITNHQKAAFAAAQKLRSRLENEGVSQDDFWNYVRRRFHVESRNDMREDHWAQLAAELSAASRDAVLFKELAATARQVLRAQKETGGVSKEKETAPETPAPDEAPESANGAAGAKVEAEPVDMSAAAPSENGAAPKRDNLFR